MSELDPEDSPYPPDFDPDRFASPELYLKTLNQQGVVAIGGELESIEKADEISDEMREMGVVAVGELVLLHAGGEGKSRFPVYYTSLHSKVGSFARGDEEEFEFDAPYQVLQEHVDEAKRRVEADETLAHLTEGAKSRHIIRIALALAAGEVVDDKE